MKIAVEGCCHGELDKIYETLAYLEDVNSIKLDLLLICGDFQAVRNKSDLQCMAVPEKYQCMNTFYKYYSGEKKAPVLTVFIGGNHEASNYMQELPYGGWVAPNIFYMGYANVLRFGGLRIAGLSGIYNPRHFAMGHFERPPYSRDTVRSAYHVRNLEVFRLKQISRPLDIVMSHDWPRGIYNFGNKEGLIRHKSFLQKEIEQDCLGSPPAEELLHRLQPSYWFSAHLHTKFAAFVEHQSEGIGSKTTKFLSLDKCLPRRRFLQVLDFPHDEGFPLQLELDPEWLCILRTTDHLLNLHRTKTYMPGPGSSEKWDFRVTDAEIESVKEDFGNDMRIPENFTTTVPAYSADEAGRRVSDFPSPTVQVNPQTTLLCTMLDLSDPNAMFLGRESSFALDPDDSNLSTARDSDNEDVLSGDETDDANVTYESSMDGTFNSSFNPDEIQLDVDNDEDEGIGEMENESEANVSTASSGAGDVDECLAVRLSGVNPLDESSDLREADEDELQSILDAQAARKSANSPRELDDQDISTEGSVKQKSLAGAVSPPFRLSVSENITTSSPRPLGESPRPLDESARPLGESPRPLDESPRPLGESETDKSSQDEDDELGEILAAQAKLKSSPLQSDNSTGCCNVTDAVESSSSPRSSIGKQKYDVDSTVEIEEQPTSKKFKRRNLSMYSGDEEDCV